MTETGLPRLAAAIPKSSPSPTRQPADSHARFVGSTPGAVRRVLPILLFRKFDPRMEYDQPDDPQVYLLAFCHLRQQPRTFRLDRILPVAEFITS